VFSDLIYDSLDQIRVGGGYVPPDNNLFMDVVSDR
jgi:hypothetical protein